MLLQLIMEHSLTKVVNHLNLGPTLYYIDHTVCIPIPVWNINSILRVTCMTSKLIKSKISKKQIIFVKLIAAFINITLWSLPNSALS